METLTKETLEKNLKLIGYTLRGKYPNEWIVDNKGNNTYFRVMNDHIEKRIGAKDNNDAIDFCIMYGKAKIVLLDDEGASKPAVCITDGTDALFINLYCYNE